MYRIPEHILKLLDEWVESQVDPMNPTEPPQELQDYLEQSEQFFGELEAKGIMMG